MDTTIILVGPMAAGKSTIGKKLAQVLDCPFYDVDQVIEEKTGVHIPWIFEQEGEAGFRKREHDVLNDLMQRQGCVLATGGGTVLLPENRSLLKSRGLVFYLRVTVEQQLRQLGRDPGKRRPLLAKGNPREILKNLNALREPLYREVAQHVIEIEQYRVPELISCIIKLAKA